MFVETFAWRLRGCGAMVRTSSVGAGELTDAGNELVFAPPTESDGSCLVVLQIRQSVLW